MVKDIYLPSGRLKHLPNKYSLTKVSKDRVWTWKHLPFTSSPWAHLHVVGMLRFMSDINQPSLPTPFYSVLVSISVFMALSTVFHSIHSHDISPVSHSAPQWGAADAEIKVPSGETTELKRSHFKAWSRSVYRHTCYAYCQGFLPCLFLPFQSIHLHFFQNLSRLFPVLACRIK